MYVPFPFPREYLTKTTQVFGRSVISAHLSADDERLIVHSGDDDGAQSVRWYNMEDLRASAAIPGTGATWDPAFVTSNPELQYELSWRDASVAAEVKTVYVAGTRWPTMDGIPPITSTTILYDSVTGPVGGPKGRWRIAQYYDRTDAPTSERRW